MSQVLKANINAMYGLCDTLDEGPFGLKQISEDGEVSTRQALRIDLMMFLMYLSASDGTVEEEEAEFLEEYLDWDLSPEQIKKFIKERKIYSTRFENEVPLVMKLLVRTDQALCEKGEHEKLVSELLYEIYNELGKEFLACDSDIDDNEVQDLTIYLNTLKKYIQEEIKGDRNFVWKNKAEGDELTSQTEKKTDSEESLEELLEELDSLTGLETVKKDVNSLINLLQIRKIREQRGMKQMPMSLHLVFSGNPGTGKTTVARLLSKIYHHLGILSEGHLVEVDRSGLVGGYVGQTAIKVQEVIQKALGGILFVDEAYSLTANKGANDYGMEAVDTLLKGMEDHRDDLIVIVAGYPDLMNEFLNSNPGLRSRFNKFINFEDYKPTELVLIFNSMCKKNGYQVTDECLEYVTRFFEKRYMTRNANFANGRDVRNFFEMAIVNQANRLSVNDEISDKDLSEISVDDVLDIVI